MYRNLHHPDRLLGDAVSCQRHNGDVQLTAETIPQPCEVSQSLKVVEKMVYDIYGFDHDLVYELFAVL